MFYQSVEVIVQLTETYNSDFVLGINSSISQTTFICTCNQTPHGSSGFVSRPISHYDCVACWRCWRTTGLVISRHQTNKVKHSAAESYAAMTKTCLEQAKRWPCFGLLVINLFSGSVSQMKRQPLQVRPMILFKWHHSHCHCNVARSWFCIRGVEIQVLGCFDAVPQINSNHTPYFHEASNRAGGCQTV